MSNDYPARLYVEVTTRCNLRCSMCVKQTEGCGIAEADMPFEVFSRLASCLPHAEAVLLNGVGEPLLHPQLPEMVRFARQHMVPDAMLGFQSNGLPLTPQLAERLLAAGLSTVCLSVDSIASAEMETLHGGGQTMSLGRSFAMLREARQRTGNDRFRIGAEFVIMRRNLHELPQVVRWASEQGAAYMLASHVLPYDERAVAESVFTQDSPEVLAFFGEWRDKAAALGLDLDRYYSLFRKFHRSEDEKRLVAFVQEMQQAASAQGISLHLKRLIEQSGAIPLAEVEAVFAEARAVAEECCLELHLPTAAARKERRCDFVEDGAVFITPDGGAHPCYFLWHRYSCHLDGQKKTVRPERFGSVAFSSLEAIWRSPEYASFRKDVCAYEYPDCSSCTMGPCDDMTGEMGPFEHDCHGITVPCGHCPWCLGGLQCLL
ncbi:radical SAM/SPASM family putative metalloenzyme maturase [Desulfovibrio mangrovi]|uniref:radical SAM/SPASM family putative metalloenzyme maturase n=1 Tax=Desulfovibrio mangrovi TaxID=2976983 RepID=UPI00224608CF|nr:radical SAM/SPASM family putative metalloenzyme maturase [Desulfovibrio mangrovi]UZP67262.1 radical SAM/SPASM family putative metalloenzyme maturase [Desulfovibrio mangrovi]